MFEFLPASLTTLQKRFVLFLLGCIPTRILLAYSIPYILNNSAGVLKTTMRMLLGLICLVISIGFLSIFIFGWREKGAETFGQPIWWNLLRPIHSLLYGIVAYNLIFVSSKQSLYLERNLLVFDAFMGLGAFLIYHTYNGDIWKLF